MVGPTPRFVALPGKQGSVAGTEHPRRFNHCNSLLACRSPDSAKVKPKMVYAGSKDALTRALVGVSIKITATDSSELSESIIQDQCRKIAG